MKTSGLIISAAGIVLLLLHAFIDNTEKIAFIIGGLFLISGAALIVGSIKRKE
ncbi:MAG: hypothetical protein ABI792_00605 [bacterium]